MKIRLALAALSVALATVCAGAANAATDVTSFTFKDSSANVLATGSFSYNASLTGLLTYADLSAFNINVLGQSYNLSFVQSLPTTPGYDYDYLGYNASTQAFVIGNVGGYAGPYPGYLAAVEYGPNIGFFFDGLPSEGGDGFISAYNPYTYAQAAVSSVSVSTSAVPEPATWAMFLLGFGVIGWTLRSQRKGALTTV